MSEVNKRLGYLSGAPRVSTRPEAGALGPRTHVLGVMNAFRWLGWEVRPYIVGDRVPLKWVAGEATERAMRQSLLKRIAADLVRLGLGAVHGPLALREVGQVDWMYERYGAFQALGWWFQRKGIPWILETNAILYREATQDRSTVALSDLLRKAERWSYRQCDVLVCISQELADLIVQDIGVPRHKIVVMPNGVDTEHLDPSIACPVRFFEGPTLGFVGQLQSWQRLDLLLEAIAHLHKESIFYKLVVVGDGVMRETWEMRAASLGLAQHVRFVGRVPWEEIPNYIAGFDLGYAGAVPLSAGLMYLSPLKLYEYAAMGKPIVAADHADARKLMADGAKVYLFEPGNREGLIRALRQAFKEREHWLKAGIRNRSVVVAKHSWESRVRNLIENVETILVEKYGTAYPARRRS